MKKVTLLMTPGLDSYLADYYLSNNFRGKMSEMFGDDYILRRIYFNLGSRYSEQEVFCLRNNYPEDYVEIDENLKLGDIEAQTAFIPNRNLMLVTLAQAKHDSDFVIINGVYDDRVCDNKRTFFDRYSEILSESANKQVEVTSLFWNFEKAEVVKIYREQELNDLSSIINLAQRTFSCYTNNSVSDLYKDTPIYKMEDGHFEKVIDANIAGCMNCKACYRRNAAISAGNIFIPFKNMHIAYEAEFTVDAEIHPNRSEAQKAYNKFLRSIREKEEGRKG